MEKVKTKDISETVPGDWLIDDKDDIRKVELISEDQIYFDFDGDDVYRLSDGAGMDSDGELSSDGAFIRVPSGADIARVEKHKLVIKLNSIEYSQMPLSKLEKIAAAVDGPDTNGGA